MAIHKLEDRPDSVSKGTDGEISVKLPTVLYSMAAGCAATVGTTVDAFVAKIMIDSLKVAAETALLTKP